ncbi:MAG: glycosyltransferase family 4 protein [Proteobacteria bacterium]|nr:glycosyltransferase family 4 protein [Pseudomonadota bacterium]
MRILHVAETIKGGIATYFRELVPLQVNEFGAENVVLMVPISQIGELGCVNEIAKVISYDDSGPRWRRAIRLAFACAEFSRTYLPEVLHIHSTFAGFSVRPIMRVLGPNCRVVYCPHGWAWDRPLSGGAKKALGLVELVLSRLCYKVICISDYEHQAALKVGFPRDRLMVIRNGISIERQKAMPVSGPVWPERAKVRLLFVGRLDKQKGVDVLIEAMESLSDEFHLVIAGDVVVGGGAVKSISNCSLTGWVNAAQLETLYSAADILIVPSRWEGFGLVAIEGMRAKLPVVVSNAGALPEIVDDGVTGVVFPSESSMDLASSIKMLSRMDLTAVGVAGYERFKKEFSVNRLHRQLVQLYCE